MDPYSSSKSTSVLATTTEVTGTKFSTQPVASSTQNVNDYAELEATATNDRTNRKYYDGQIHATSYPFLFKRVDGDFDSLVVFPSRYAELLSQLEGRSAGVNQELQIVRENFARLTNERITLSQRMYSVDLLLMNT